MASRDTESQTSSSFDVEERSNDQTRSGDRETPKQKSGKKRRNKSKTSKEANKTSKEAREAVNTADYPIGQVQQPVPPTVDSPDGAQDDDASAQREEGDDSVDTETLIYQELGADGKSESSSEDDEDSDPDDPRGRPFKGPFKFTPQEVFDSVKGGENARDMGWSRRFLRTPVNTVGGRMPFIEGLRFKRQAQLWLRSKSKFERTGENNYTPTLHITQNQGYTPSMIKDLSYKSFRNLQNEWCTSQALAPDTVDFAPLIPQTLHKQLGIELTGFSTVHYPDLNPWC
jgi:hypothetical protein